VIPNEVLTEETVKLLRQTVERLHRCKAVYMGKTHVTEKLKANWVWDGDVYMFALKRHPVAKLAYAWSAPREDSNQTRCYVFLHHQTIHSALDAVRAAILPDATEK
jgi:hypothetical protein